MSEQHEMNETLEKIHTLLTEIVSRINDAVPNDEPFGNAHNNWSFPGLTRAELTEEAQSIADLIEEQGGNELGKNEARLKDYIRRLQHLKNNTINQLWKESSLAVPAYLYTLQGLRKALGPALSRDIRAETAGKLKKLTQQVRAMESRLNSIEPRTTDLDTMLERIEKAYNAADQLPTDMESLAEARQQIVDLAKEAARHQGDVMRIKEQAEEIDKQLKNNAEDAKDVLARCETAYSAATSVGLAAAFSERSSALTRSIWFWIGALVIALTAGSYFGSAQLNDLGELFKNPNVPISVVALNLLLSVLSIGAPVWFAWLSTKQIGQRFRLAEDYAFKASISRAYEGFRRETARFDKEMEAKLLTSALTRLDELPLRLVETDSHGSPWHELASSHTVKQAMQMVPGFAVQVKELAVNALAAVNPNSKRSDKPKVKAVASARETANDNV